MNTRSLISALALSLSTAACGGVEPLEADQPDAGMPGEPDAPDPTDPQPDAPPPLQAGSVDTTYGTNGAALLDGVSGYAADIAVQDNKFIICSTVIGASSQGVVSRVALDGTLDTTFGINEDGHSPMGSGASCRRVAVRPDGSIVAFLVYSGGPEVMIRLDRDGRNPDYSLSSSILKGMNLDDNMLLGAFSGSLMGQTSQDAEHPTDTAGGAAIVGTAVKPFSIGGKHVIAGTFTLSGASGWGLVREETEGTLNPPTTILIGGGPQADFMYDAAELADGSIITVGGGDQDTKSMLAKFPPAGSADPVRLVIQPTLGQISSSRRVIVDGAGRPIVVGSAYKDGKTQMVWQRFNPADLTADTSYAGGGTMIQLAPSGSGEVVGAVRHGGSIYLLALYDVEKPELKTALVKIAE